MKLAQLPQDATGMVTMLFSPLFNYVLLQKSTVPLDLETTAGPDRLTEIEASKGPLGLPRQDGSW